MLKNLKPISLILLTGALSYPVASHAGITPGQPNVDFSQQNGKITGIVEDSFGHRAGASVVVKGTTNGNITDMNGQFILEGVKMVILYKSRISVMSPKKSNLRDRQP